MYVFQKNYAEFLAISFINSNAVYVILYSQL